MSGEGSGLEGQTRLPAHNVVEPVSMACPCMRLLRMDNISIAPHGLGAISVLRSHPLVKVLAGQQAQLHGGLLGVVCSLWAFLAAAAALSYPMSGLRAVTNIRRLVQQLVDALTVGPVIIRHVMIIQATMAGM